MTNDEQRIPEEHVDEIRQLKTFLHTYGKPLSTVLLVVLVAVLGVRIYRGRQQARLARASALLQSARGIQDLESLTANYAATPVAPLASLRLAKAYFDAGRYDQAMETYRNLAEEHADHRLAPAAQLGIAHALEAQGRYAEALEAFTAFGEEHAESFLAPQAFFGRIRCLRQLRRADDAKALLEEFITAHPASGWSAAAEEQLELIAQDAEPESVAPPAAAIPTTPLPVVPPAVPEADGAEPSGL